MSDQDKAFEAWLCREMPAGTVIGDPKWWAPKILNALAHRDAPPAVAHNDAIGTVEVTVRGERRFEFNQNSTPLCLGVHQVYIDPRTHVDGAAQKLDKLLSQVINRRVMVEQKLFDMAAGKLPMPDADGLRKLAMELGDPAHNPPAQPVQPSGGVSLRN